MFRYEFRKKKGTRIRIAEKMIKERWLMCCSRKVTTVVCIFGTGGVKMPVGFTWPKETRKQWTRIFARVCASGAYLAFHRKYLFHGCWRDSLTLAVVWPAAPSKIAFESEKKFYSRYTLNLITWTRTTLTNFFYTSVYKSDHIRCVFPFKNVYSIFYDLCI